jgi:U3 small nucleolar RNA-associated protein 19
MPFLAATDVAGKKRKRSADGNEKASKGKSRKATKSSSSRESEVLSLESQINESRKHYNNIVTLISIAKSQDEGLQVRTLTAVALCRVFCRLLAAGSLESSKKAPQSEIVITQWLRERQNEYTDVVCSFLASEEEELQTNGLTLAMRLCGEEIKRRDNAWNTGIFSKMFPSVLQSEAAVAEFASKFFTKYDDVRFHSLQNIP